MQSASIFTYTSNIKHLYCSPCKINLFLGVVVSIFMTSYNVTMLYSKKTDSKEYLSHVSTQPINNLPHINIFKLTNNTVNEF